MQTLRVPYKTVDGVSIPTDIHFEDTTSSRNVSSGAPVLIMFHGGGFAVGEASMNNRDQIQDCIERGWIVLSAEYRLCPGVSAYEGSVKDARDLLQWAQSDALSVTLREAGAKIQPDREKVMAMGTSAGGTLALSLAWDVPKPPFAILDFYGPVNFHDSFWKSDIPQIKAKLPSSIPEGLREQVATERTIYSGGMSLEGQSGPRAPGPPKPNFNDPRVLYLFSCIGNGKMLELMDATSDDEIKKIDPYLNIHSDWPPTIIVHGAADFMVPTDLSRQLHARLKEHNVQTELIEVEGEPHTFVGMMKKGSETWKRQRDGFNCLSRLLDEKK